MLSSIYMHQPLYIMILCLGVATYVSAVWQMLTGTYSPSFFSRGVWFLLGINSFASVVLAEGSRASVVLAGTLFVGNAAVFGVSCKKVHANLAMPKKSAWRY